MEKGNFITFFNEVLKMHLLEFGVKDEEVNTAISKMHLTYSIEGRRRLMDPVNYDDPAYRCAYLHKYAGFHAEMVHRALSSHAQYVEILRTIPVGECDVMNICCLGGGPGTDICGLSKTLQELQVKKLRLTIIDVMEQWSSTFSTLFEAAKLPKYSNLNAFFSGIISKKYIRDDLLSPGNETKEALESADLVTMVKFVSAVKQSGIIDMLKALFKSMKHGAVVFFIDNAGGGFYEKVSEAAEASGFKKKYYSFLKRPNFKIQHRFGFYSISSSAVAVQMWKKEYKQDLKKADLRCDDDEGPSKKYLKKEDDESQACSSGIGDNQPQPYDDPCVSIDTENDKDDSHPCKLSSDDNENDSAGAMCKSQEESETDPVTPSAEEPMNEDSRDAHTSCSRENSSATVQSDKTVQSDRGGECEVKTDIDPITPNPEEPMKEDDRDAHTSCSRENSSATVKNDKTVQSDRGGECEVKTDIDLTPNPEEPMKEDDRDAHASCSRENLSTTVQSDKTVQSDRKGECKVKTDIDPRKKKHGKSRKSSRKKSRKSSFCYY